MIISRKAHFKLIAFVLENQMPFGYYKPFCWITIEFEIENSSMLLRGEGEGEGGEGKIYWIIIVHNHIDIISFGSRFVFQSHMIDREISSWSSMIEEKVSTLMLMNDVCSRSVPRVLSFNSSCNCFRNDMSAGIFGNDNCKNLTMF